MLVQFNRKFKPLSVAARAAVYFSLCNILVKGLNFIGAPLFTRLMSTEEYGKLSVFTSFEQLILVLATWEVAIGPYQRGLFKYKDDVKNFTISTQSFSNIITIIFFTVILLCFDAFKALTGINFVMTIMLLIYLLTQPGYSCWLYRKRVNYDYKISVVVTLLISTTTLLAPFIAVLVIQGTAEVKFIYSLLPMIIISLFFYIRNFMDSEYTVNVGCRKNLRSKFIYFKFLLKFSPPLAVHAISFYVLGQADRVMIAKLDSNHHAALYSVAYTVANMAMVVQSAVTSVLLPWTYDKMEKHQYIDIRKKTAPMFAAIGGIYLLFIIVSPELIRLLFTAEYYDTIWCIPPIAIGSYFMFLYSMFVNIESYLEETKYIAYVSIFCAFLNIILNYFGIVYIGYIASAYTTLFCYVLFAIGHFYFMKKVLKKKSENEKIYNGKYIMLIGLAEILLMIFITIIYNKPLIRYTTLVITLLVIMIAVYKFFKTLPNGL